MAVTTGSSLNINYHPPNSFRTECTPCDAVQTSQKTEHPVSPSPSLPAAVGEYSALMAAQKCTGRGGNAIRPDVVEGAPPSIDRRAPPPPVHQRPRPRSPFLSCTCPSRRSRQHACRSPFKHRKERVLGCILCQSDSDNYTQKAVRISGL